jgi:hypothetical protein
MGLDESVERTRITGAVAALRGRENAVAASLIVAGIVLLSMAVRYALALDLPAPWLMGDELLYADRAKSFLEEGRLLFREEYNPFATAYPALIAPAWAAESVTTSYEIAKAINVVLITMTSVVAFFWAKRLATIRYAFVAAGLVLLMPTFEYTGMLMMENASLPASLLAMFVIARALEHPTLLWQLMAFAAIGLAGIVRVQLLTLAVVYLTAIVLVAVFARLAQGRPLRASLTPFALSFGICVLGALGYVSLKLATGSSLTSGLGAYSFVGEADYDLVDVARWFVWHAGELTLSVGFLPVVCVGLLLWAAIRRGSSLTAADQAFVAVALASSFWFALQAAAFASRFSGRIEERYMVYAAPVLLIALAVWVGRDLPRSAASILVASLAPALLVTTIPFERLFNVPILADTFGLIPFMRLTTFLDGGVSDLRIVIAGGLALAVLLLLVLGLRASRVLLPASVALFFLLSGYTVHGVIQDQSAASAAATGVSDPNWVDDTIGSDGEVGYIYGPSDSVNPHRLWQTEFWNRSVKGVYPLNADPVSSFSDDELDANSAGRLVPKRDGQFSIDEPYVLADPNLAIVGKVVARPGPLALIRVSRPLRIASSVDGLHVDGWMGSQAGLTQYEPLPRGARRMRVRASRAGWTGADVPGRVTITAGALQMTNGAPTLGQPTSTREWTVHSGQTRTFDLPVPRVPFRVEVRVSPTFSPAQFGQGDTRQLGVQLAFSSG